MSKTSEITLYPSPILHTPCDFVKDISKVKKIITIMEDTMYENHGIGLAANQIGINESIFVMDVTYPSTGEKNPKHFINPGIIDLTTNTVKQDEGCLSVPFGFHQPVERAVGVKLSYTNIDGVIKDEVFEGLEAICIQHEMDHLNGILFIDRLSNLRKDIFRRKIKKAVNNYKRGQEMGEFIFNENSSR